MIKKKIKRYYTFIFVLHNMNVAKRKKNKQNVTYVAPESRKIRVRWIIRIAFVCNEDLSSSNVILGLFLP